MKSGFKQAGMAFIAATWVLIFASSAQAAAILRLEVVGGPSVDVVDGDGDGFLNFNGSLGVFTVNAAIGTTKPLLPNAPYSAEMNLNSLHIAGGAGTVIVTFADTGFVMNGGLSPALVSASVGGNLSAPAGSTYTAEAWVDPTNNGGNPLVVGFTIPGGAVPIFSPVFTAGPNPAFSGTDSILIPLASPFAFFERSTVTLTGAGLAGSNLNQVAAVPEPASLLLLGGGLLGVGAMVRRRRRTGLRVEASSRA